MFTYIGRGCQSIVYGYKDVVIKIGKIPAEDITFLKNLPKYKPIICGYYQDRYIPLLDKVRDIVIMKRYTVAHDDISGEFAHRVAWHIKDDLQRYYSVDWKDNSGWNIGYDEKGFYIIDA